jgi:hypothetical protein
VLVVVEAKYGQMPVRAAIGEAAMRPADPNDSAGNVGFSV